MHGLGPGAIGRDTLDTFNDVAPVSLGDPMPVVDGER